MLILGPRISYLGTHSESIPVICRVDLWIGDLLHRSSNVVCIWGVRRNAITPSYEPKDLDRPFGGVPDTSIPGSRIPGCPYILTPEYPFWGFWGFQK